jgi:adenine phosphoribosyltransferase
MDLKALIRDVPDFPKKGIVFKDIMPLLARGDALRQAVDELASPYAGRRIHKVVSAEARGFIFGPAVACKLGAGFAAVRKPGKLPWKSRKITYELEYGSDTVAIHEDAIGKGERVLLLDDLLATGGTMAACAKLVEGLGGTVVGMAFLIELEFLKGRSKLAGYDVFSVIRF